MHVESGKIFTTYAAAAKHVGGNRWGVKHCAMGIQGSHKGQHFKYVSNKKSKEQNS
jgi:hypothetical protein